jgi:hypothetical protein
MYYAYHYNQKNFSMKCIKENSMKSITSMILVGLFSFNGIYAMQSPIKTRILNIPEKRPAIVYELTWRDALTASAILSGPLATIMSGIYAHDCGFSLPMSAACSLGTAASYAVIIKALLYDNKK